MMRFGLLVAVGGTCFLAAPAMADVIVNSSPAYSCDSGTGKCTQSFDTGVQPTDWLTTQNNREVFDLNLFDTSLGTLNSVTFNLTTSSSITSGSLKNNSATSQTFDFTQNTKFTATSANSTLNSLLNGLSLTTTYDTGDLTLASGASFSVPSGSDSASGCFDGPTASTPCVAAAVSTFAAFGGGVTDVTLATKTADSLSGGGGLISFQVVTNAEATLAVVYNYTPKKIPEPMTASLFASALAGLAFFRRRRPT